MLAQLAVALIAILAPAASPDSQQDPNQDPPAPPGVLPNELCAVFGYWRYPDPAAGDMDINGSPVESCYYPCSEVCVGSAAEHGVRRRTKCKQFRGGRAVYGVWVNGACCPANNPLSSCYYAAGGTWNVLKTARPKFKCKMITCPCTTRQGCDWELQNQEEVTVQADPKITQSSTCVVDCRTGFLGRPVQ